MDPTEDTEGASVRGPCFFLVYLRPHPWPFRFMFFLHSSPPFFFSLSLSFLVLKPFSCRLSNLVPLLHWTKVDVFFFNYHIHFLLSFYPTSTWVPPLSLLFPSSLPPRPSFRFLFLFLFLFPHSLTLPASLCFPLKLFSFFFLSHPSSSFFWSIFSNFPSSELL